jgi:hypothetical protein
MTSEPMTSVFREESDSTLVAATKNGESQAFEFLVKRHEAKTFSVAFRITRNREDAQDVVQQSFRCSPESTFLLDSNTNLISCESQLRASESLALDRAMAATCI